MSGTSISFGSRELSAVVESTEAGINATSTKVTASRVSSFEGSPAPLVITHEAPSIVVSLAPVAVASGSVPVIDSLESSSAVAALSANQGKVLDGKISLVRTDYGAHETDFSAQFLTMLS